MDNIVHIDFVHAIQIVAQSAGSLKFCMLAFLHVHLLSYPMNMACGVDENNITCISEIK